MVVKGKDRGGDKMKPEDKTKICPECNKEMKQHLIGSGMFGVSTLLVFFCENKKCKFHNVLRLVTVEDIVED